MTDSTRPIRVAMAVKAWLEVPTRDSSWGLRMRDKIATYYRVSVVEMEKVVSP